MDNNKVSLAPEQEIIVKHLRKSRDLSKHILKITPGVGSSVIKHKFIVTSCVSDRVEMISEITFLPLIRLYKTDKIVDDENIMNEDVENGY